jgi:hypothetical protein
MFHATSGGFYTTTVTAPDELRVVFESALATNTAYVRVLTAGDANDVHDYHNKELLAQMVVASVTDGEGTVAARDIDVASVSTATGTYAAYKLTLARQVTPSEVVGVTVQSPYVRDTLATTESLAPLVVAMPRLEISVAPITPQAWAPSAAVGVTAPALPSAHTLVVGAAVALHFAFEAPADFATDAAASFTATANGAPLALNDATVAGKSLVVRFEAASAVKHTFVFVAFGTMFVFVVEAARVYSFPGIAGTSRSAKPVVTLGEQLPVVSTFDAALPSGMTASAVVTALGFESEAASYAGVVSGSSVSFSVLVARDVAHSATVTLSYGGTSRGGYSWGSGALTASSIHTFPSSFAVDGSANGFGSPYSLKVGAAGSLTLTFAGGDMLHSDDVGRQISYVGYTQGTSTNEVAIESCSASLGTVTLAAISPADTTTLTLLVRLKGPDGAPSAEMSADVSVSPAWEALAVTTASVPAPHILVVGSPVVLDFDFTALPTAAITSAASLTGTVTLNGSTTAVPLPLGSASLVGTRLTVPYTALAACEHVFTLVALGQSKQFVVPADAVFTFPTVGTTTMSPPYVTLGQSAQLTTTFESAFPTAARATTVITPQGKTPTVELATTVSGLSAVVSHTVAFDLLHVGAITVTYGTTSKVYSWGVSPLTEGSIYTFPSGFTIDGSANGYGATYDLKVGSPGALTLTFAGGDGLHSSSVSAQIGYVRYTQGDVTKPLTTLTCSDEADTITVASLTPVDATELTLHVKLRGPESASALSLDLVATVGPTAISPAWEALSVTTASVPAPHILVVGSPVVLDFDFTALPTAAITSAASFTGTVTLNGSTTELPLPLGSVSLVGTRLTVPYTALAAGEHVFTLVALGLSKQFVVPASAVFTFPTVGATTRSPDMVTLGHPITLTTAFERALPSSATATVLVTPEGEAGEPHSGSDVSLSNLGVAVTHTVRYDKVHTGTVTVHYGQTSKVYSWATSPTAPLTAANIYTFPSSFSVDGGANGYDGGATLKANATGSLKLTFSGGDMLFSDSVAAQVSYVEYTQDGVTLQITSGLTCSDPLETLTIAAITPTSATDLIIKVQLKGPNNALSSELQAVVVVASAFEAPSTMPQLAFRLPSTANGSTIVGSLTNDGQFWTSDVSSTSQGVVVDHAFSGDFSLVLAAPGWTLAYGWRPLTNAMVCSAGATPSDFRLISTSFHTSDGCLANFTPSGSYTYTAPLFLHNVRNTTQGGFLTRANMCYKYERIGSALSLSSGVGAVGPWTVRATGTVDSASKVICLLGVCNGSGAVVSSIRTAYKGASPVKSIYVTDASGMRTSGYNNDASASSLVVAWPCDGTVDVSHNINTASTTKTVTLMSNATVVTTANAKYYGAAFYTNQPQTANRSVTISGLPSGYLDGDFTFEAWIRPQGVGGYVFGSLPLGYGVSGYVENRMATPTPNQQDGLGTLHPNGGAILGVNVSQNGNYRAITATNSNFASVMQALNAYDAFPCVSDQWSHYAYTKRGYTYSVYINGIMVSTYTDPLSRTLTGYNTSIMVGGVRNDGNGSTFLGYIQDVRVYLSCKYTSNFYVKYDGTM